MKRRMPRFARLMRQFAVYGAFVCAVSGQGQAETRLAITPVSGPLVLFDPKRDGCDGNDVPDAPFRAYRDAAGGIVAFGLHYENRRLMGPRLDALKIDCKVAFRGTRNSNPKAYDDRSWITATWTEDGKTVHALAHHEFQAHAHRGRCSFPEYMKCWWNSVLNITSHDSGARFAKAAVPVMAASPQPSEVGQGRHRGFFNPSNILARGAHHYVLIGTTGWEGQPSGVCLFRSGNLADPAAWRAFDGVGFEARFPDPYSDKPPKQRACVPVAPFPAPVGSITRHGGTGLFVAVYQAAAGMPDGRGGTYTQSGFYSATSVNLIDWSPPSLLMATKSLYDNACGESVLRSYPVLIDPVSPSRNFAETGDSALLLYSQMRIEGCSHTHDRKLIAQKLRISAYKVE